ncbi:Hypothetical predicted protein [Cloeon dipterum]|uniref:CCHC-type domain-containing protein n=1 Tax=Cloeon dipterum TaxID=197152 RepID=A0A8S1CTV4_9INSE|nr:Hypothetical predicted protein [Cloeon dipterum]
MKKKKNFGERTELAKEKSSDTVGKKKLKLASPSGFSPNLNKVAELEKKIAPDSNDGSTIASKKKMKGKKNKKEPDMSKKTGAVGSNLVSSGGQKFAKPVNQATSKKRRAEKQLEGTDPKRRKPLSETIFVDGRSIEIEIYDGFPVLKEDAARLRELYKKMLKEGIPKAEARKAMKLERRRAEKALSREKKKVCFHCRQAGHMMTDCPKLSSGSCDVCFKCGSTEHKSPQCKVSQGNDFKFSTCFVCGESGHISRQCPDNPRGLYPQGGGCRICGDVTHLKRDCPQLVEERQEKTVRVSSVGNYNSIEDLDEKKPAPAVALGGPKKNKIIKF